MKIPTITGLIRRRILVNYRVAPELAAALLPAGFRPKLAGGFSIAGICLIRLEQIRPKGLPRILGMTSENSAHRIAVEWDDAEGTQDGVFVPRRDTSSWFNAAAGGRVFPGVHHHSRFAVEDAAGRISIRVTAAADAKRIVEISASEADALPAGSVFGSLAESSAFFETGCVGFSPRPDSCKLDGLRLATEVWKVSPLAVDSVHSSFFDDRGVFPAEGIEFDHALLMRNIPHEWHEVPTAG